MWSVRVWSIAEWSISNVICSFIMILRFCCIWLAYHLASWSGPQHRIIVESLTVESHCRLLAYSGCSPNGKRFMGLKRTSSMGFWASHELPMNHDLLHEPRHGPMSLLLWSLKQFETSSLKVFFMDLEKFGIRMNLQEGESWEPALNRSDFKIISNIYDSPPRGPTTSRFLFEISIRNLLTTLILVRSHWTFNVETLSNIEAQSLNLMFQQWTQRTLSSGVDFSSLTLLLENFFSWVLTWNKQLPAHYCNRLESPITQVQLGGLKSPMKRLAKRSTKSWGKVMQLKLAYLLRIAIPSWRDSLQLPYPKFK